MSRRLPSVIPGRVPSPTKLGSIVVGEVVDVTVIADPGLDWPVVLVFDGVGVMPMTADEACKLRDLLAAAQDLVRRAVS